MIINHEKASNFFQKRQLLNFVYYFELFEKLENVSLKVFDLNNFLSDLKEHEFRNKVEETKTLFNSETSLGKLSYILTDDLVSNYDNLLSYSNSVVSKNGSINNGGRRLISTLYHSFNNFLTVLIKEEEDYNSKLFLISGNIDLDKDDISGNKEAIQVFTMLGNNTVYTPVLILGCSTTAFIKIARRVSLSAIHFAGHGNSNGFINFSDSKMSPFTVCHYLGCNKLDFLFLNLCHSSILAYPFVYGHSEHILYWGGLALRSSVALAYATNYYNHLNNTNDFTLSFSLCGTSYYKFI